MLQPGETSEELLRSAPPPYPSTLLLCMLLSIFVPIFAQLYKYGQMLYDAEAILSLFLVVIFTFLTFILLEGIFLKIFSVDFSLRQLYASAAYSIAPLLLALWLIYFFNYISTGRLSILQLILNGRLDVPDRFIHVVPIASMIALVNALVVFLYCVRFLGQMHTVTALFLTLLSLGPFLVSVSVGIFLGELAHPGTAEIFFRVLTEPSALVAVAPT